MPMFWRRDSKPMKPGLTGSGEFIHNLDWWLWDDAASPGLISIDRFGALGEAALTSDERQRLSVLLVKDTVRNSGLSSEDETFTKNALRKKGDYLASLRQKDVSELDCWLGFNFMTHNDGWVRDQIGTNLNRDILRVVAAYLNCLEFWGFRYTWRFLQDGKGEPALLLYRNSEPRFCLTQSEIQYVLGKPYRFSISMKSATWHFDSTAADFAICPRNSEPTTF